MCHDLTIVGPDSDPVGINGKKDGAEALKTIKTKDAGFFSRGDRLGTHGAELRLWKAVDIDS